MHESPILEGEIEIDETQPYKTKKSHVPGEPYAFIIYG